MANSAEKEDGAYFRERGAVTVLEGRSTEARRERVGESEWWRRASQPIVSEFVYDDGALSKKFLWLTSTSSTRNTKVNPLLTELSAGISSALYSARIEDASLSLAAFADSSARINHISRGWPRMAFDSSYRDYPP